MDITDVIKRLEVFKREIYAEVREIVKDEKKQLLTHIANEQMYSRGEDADSAKITPAYAPSTIRYKKRKGQPTDRVTLRDTGRFHKTLKLKAKPKEAEIFSQVKYARFLLKKYGGKVLGVQRPKIDSFSQKTVMPQLTENLRKRLPSSSGNLLKR